MASFKHAGPVASRTAAELTSIDVGSWFNELYDSQRIPTLDAVLQRYKGRVHLHVVSAVASQAPHNRHIASGIGHSSMLANIGLLCARCFAGVMHIR